MYYKEICCAFVVLQYLGKGEIIAKKKKNLKSFLVGAENYNENRVKIETLT